MNISGFKIGHWTSSERPTGCTVVLCEAGAVASVDVRGAAPGTRETDLLAPENTVEHIHGLVLTGGSAFGLDVASGVMRWLEARGHGFHIGPACVPIVPAAVLFDLWHPLQRIRPGADAGEAACDAAISEFDQLTWGRGVGAGAGATVGKFFGPDRASPGGIGLAVAQLGAVKLAAVVAVNALGDVLNERGDIICGARTADDKAFENTAQAIREGRILNATATTPPKGSATTIGAILTDAVITKTQAKKIAQMAHDGLARSIHPVHTAFDGDTLFVAASGASGQTRDLSALGSVAADLVAQAVRAAVRLDDK
jgi:L-aminopeptidase/D-esterase-like protein